MAHHAEDMHFPKAWYLCYRSAMLDSLVDHFIQASQGNSFIIFKLRNFFGKVQIVIRLSKLKSHLAGSQSMREKALLKGI